MYTNLNLTTLTFEVVEKSGVVTVNRPDKLNALNSTVLKELQIVLKEVEKNNEDFALRALILIGAGEKAFIAGADIKEMQSMSAKAAYDFSLLGQEVTNLMESISIPIIACVNGFAFGGGLEMAMGCDFILATEKAVVGQPEVKLGLIPGYGGTQRLIKRVGAGKARELIYTGRNLTATEALKLGLFNEICPSRDELLKRALEIVTEISKVAPLAVAMSKKAINEGSHLSNREGMLIEANYFSKAFESEDYKEGTTAFLEKRAATFKGK